VSAGVKLRLPLINNQTKVHSTHVLLSLTRALHKAAIQSRCVDIAVRQRVLTAGEDNRVDVTVLPSSYVDN